ncbi:MAG: cellulase family glycosylhydrolase [Verrucomicrobia bacterium]|nr:cellulase family glycosylhydrolase [Verrucomicrobiota bacterium]MCH8528022.1 glycoside hydrolase family 5 protein [Kiritimatiellia bacterium]
MPVILCSFVSATMPDAGEVLFEETFEQAGALNRWTRSDERQVRIVEEDRSRVLKVESDGGGAFAVLELPAERFRGSRVQVQARLRAENVSRPPHPWNGVKVMLHTAGPSREDYPQALLGTGGFDWLDASFTARIPADVTTVRLLLGLEEVSGTVWIDRVNVIVEEPPQPRREVIHTGPVHKGHDLPRLRGAMIPTRPTAGDLRDLAGLGANHIRWQLTWDTFPRSPADQATPKEYEAWIGEILDYIDTLLPLCEELGLRVLIDVHTPPGGITGRDHMRLFSEQAFQDTLIRVWEHIARRYKGHPAIWGYDLLNEPLEGPVAEGLMDWQALAGELAARIRAIDAERTLVVQAAPGGGPKALVDFTPLPQPNIVYSFHFYEPHEFTHQGVYDTRTVGQTYPGTLREQVWNKETLRGIMQLVAEWQREHHVHIYVGEFSAIRWAPGDSALNYLRDCIDLFESFGWDWAYHAFREWQGWSVEHGTDKQDLSVQTEPGSRKRLLMNWFEKNRR